MKLSTCYRAGAFALFLLWCGASSVHAQMNPGTQPRRNAPLQPMTATSPAIKGDSIPLSASATYNIGGRRALNSPEVAVKFGDHARQMKDYNNAYSWYSYALKLDAKDVHAQLGLGAIYTALNRYDEAVKTYEQVLALKPKMVEAHLGLGLVYFKQQSFDKAIESFHQALVLKPKSDEAYVGIGDCYFTQKKYAEAVAAYQKGIEAKPKSLEAHYSLGVTYLMMDNRAAAIEQGQIVKSIDKAASDRFESLLKQYDAQQK